MATERSGKLKIFHVATDFVVAKDEKSAVEYYLEMVGDDDPAFIEEVKGDVSEVPEEKWPTLTIVDIDEPGHPTQTFREAFDDMLTWKNQEYPKTLATSEY